MMPLAYLPQHVWEVGASVLALLIIVDAIAYAIRPSRWRGIAAVAVLVGIGLLAAAQLVDAEQPGRHPHDGWGGTTGIVFLCIWIIAMLAISIPQIVKHARDRRRP